MAILKFELDTENINTIQLESMRKAISRTMHAHHTDIHIRINGKDEIVQADWIKYLLEVV